VHVSQTGDMHSVGIIGLGTVGLRFIEQFAQHSQFTVTAAWDVSATARERCSSIVPVMESAEDVIAACELVYIAVPPAAHATYVQMALAAHIAIFCEKPLGIDVTESAALTAAVAASGQPSAVNFVYASAPAAVRLGELLAEGAAGEVRRMEARLQFPLWPRAWQAEATWLAGAAEGGWLREVGSHFLFLAQRLTGELSLQRSHLQRPRRDLAEHRVIAELTAGSTPLLLSGASGEAGPEIVEFIVYGTKTSFRIRDWYLLESFSRGDTEWTPVQVANDPSPALAAYRSQLDQLALMAGGLTHHLASFDEALSVQRNVESILAAR
jgi:predicted dehydrogenase